MNSCNYSDVNWIFFQLIHVVIQMLIEIFFQFKNLSYPFFILKMRSREFSNLKTWNLRLKIIIECFIPFSIKLSKLHFKQSRWMWKCSKSICKEKLRKVIATPMPQAPKSRPQIESQTFFTFKSTWIVR